MDSLVSVRFFTVIPREAGQIGFEAALTKLKGLGENPARAVAEVTVQANSLEATGDQFSGDLVRFQTENLPSVVENTGKKPTKLQLAAGQGLGHHAAFLYDRGLSVLAYQIARNAVPLGLFNGLLSAACDCPGFGFLPVLSVSDLKQLNKITPKTILVKVADPDSLEAIEDDQRNLRRSLKNLRSLADGAYVKVQIGLANNKGHLDKSAVGNLVSWLMQQRLTGKGKVGLVQVSGKDFQEGEIDLDFIRSSLGDSKRLPLSAAGQDENYKTRLEFLTECMEKNHAALKKFKPKE